MEKNRSCIMENKIHHLEMIQNIIQRMANNSFLLKGWSITLIVAIFVLSDKKLEQDYFWIAYVPIIAFWFLDSYYLQLERKFKILYDSTRLKADEVDFDLSISEITFSKLKKEEILFINSLFSVSEFLFYFPMIVILTIVFVNNIL